MNEQLTDFQVENWRRVLSLTLGPYAFIMPREQIQAYHDRVQKKSFCTCEVKPEDEHLLNVDPKCPVHGKRPA